MWFQICVLKKFSKKLRKGFIEKFYLSFARLPRYWIDSKFTRLPQVPPNQHLPVLSIKSCHLYSLVFRVCPVQVFGYPVHSQTIRVRQVHNNQVLNLASIEESSVYRLEGCICPVDLHLLYIEVQSICLMTGLGYKKNSDQEVF